MDAWQPDVVAFSLNYLANVPEVLDLARETRARRPRCFIFAGGHSASTLAWWEAYQARRPSWPAALEALDRLLTNN